MMILSEIAEKECVD